MAKAKKSNQAIYQEMVIGTLLYTVVLGFFNDYTDILYTSSYSTTFAVAVVMQLLTYATFMLKDKIVATLKQKNKDSKIAIVGSVWFIMFVSKFVFLAILNFLFGYNLEISGFIGLLIIIICLTLAQKAIELINNKLSDKA